MGRWSVVRASIAIAVACACTPTRPRSQSERDEVDVHVQTGVAADLPVITTMRTRDREVVVFASAHGLRFTVRADDGTLLADRVDRLGFAQAFPTLAHHFDTAFAGEPLWIDASAVARPGL